MPVLPELGPILDEELAALPEWYREAILLCDLRGVSREEAATLLGVPEGTLSSRLANGRKKLAARLTRRGSVAVGRGPGGGGRSGSGGSVGLKRTRRENLWARGGLVGRRCRARSARPAR